MRCSPSSPVSCLLSYMPVHVHTLALVFLTSGHTVLLVFCNVLDHTAVLVCLSIRLGMLDGRSQVWLVSGSPALPCSQTVTELVGTHTHTLAEHCQPHCCTLRPVFLQNKARREDFCPRKLRQMHLMIDQLMAHSHLRYKGEHP